MYNIPCSCGPKYKQTQQKSYRLPVSRRDERLSIGKMKSQSVRRNTKSRKAKIQLEGKKRRSTRKQNRNEGIAKKKNFNRQRYTHIDFVRSRTCYTKNETNIWQIGYNLKPLFYPSLVTFIKPNMQILSLCFIVVYKTN